MALSTLVARAGILTLGTGALLGAGSLAFGGTAVAADCNDTAVKGLTISRAIGRAASGAIQAPTHVLAFTGAAGAVAALILGATLVLVGILLVAIGRRSRGALWLLLVVGGIATVTLVGQHAASASPAATTATCTAMKPTTGAAGGTPVTTTSATTPVVTTSAPVGSNPAPGTAPIGTTPVGDPGDPVGDPGDPVGDPGGTTTPVAALPDASTPVELVLVGVAVGGAVFLTRRRRA